MFGRGCLKSGSMRTVPVYQSAGSFRVQPTIVSDWSAIGKLASINFRMVHHSGIRSIAFTQWPVTPDVRKPARPFVQHYGSFTLPT
jgi:hypothetical protein